GIKNVYIPITFRKVSLATFLDKVTDMGALAVVTGKWYGEAKINQATLALTIAVTLRLS
ncbi:4018_t:CDS:2, partial [Paraglomus occultum]